MVLDGRMTGLSEADRDRLDQCEQGAGKARTSRAVDDLRLLRALERACAYEDVRLNVAELSIMFDPYELGPRRHYLVVDAPMPNGWHDRNEWGIEIGRWEPDPVDPDFDGESATGETVLWCARASAPTIDELKVVLDTCGQQPEQLAAWADTPVGSLLAGTAFVVTRRYDDR